jgi:hypothetical protein
MKVDRVAFLHSLRNGFGLTKTCQLLQYNPKDVSMYILENPDFLEQCQNALSAGVKILFAASHEAVAKAKWDKWKQNSDYAKNFITALNLWECYCKKEEITTRKIVYALDIYKNFGEAATSMGISPGELHEKIVSDIHLTNYIRENNLATY